MEPDVLDEQAPSLTKSSGTEIQWKPSKSLLVTEVKKKQKAKDGKNKGQVRTIVKEEPKASFFHYFSEPNEEEMEEEEDEEENKPEKHQLYVEEDYDIAHAIRVQVIPDAVKWFTGEAVPEEEDEDDEGEGDDEDEDEGDDEDDEDDEDDKPAKKQSKGASKGGKGFAAATTTGAPAGGENPECKQN